MSKLSKTSYPGPGYVYVICDICGKKVRQKDTRLVQDKYNLQNNLIVCNADYDKPNPQLRPIFIKERIVPDPQYLRSEATDQYVTNAHSSRAPSAPRNLRASLSPIDDTVVLYWEGPSDLGTDPVSYTITRANPQLTFQYTIDTDIEPTFYEDTSADITIQYSYVVYAVNSFGVAASNIAYYPSQLVIDGLTAYLTTGADEVLRTGSDVYITI